MGKSAADRLANYVANTDPETVKTKLVAKRPQMISRETKVFANQESLEKRTKAILASEGAVTAILVSQYICFVKHVNRLVGTYEGGAQLNAEVAVSLSGWKTRGLVEAVLIRLRDELFSIPAPTAP